MPILVKCVEDGCLSARNGGNECGGNCAASDMRKSSYDNSVPLTLIHLQNELSKLPYMTRKIIESIGVFYYKNNKIPTISEISEFCNVSLHDAEAARFEIRKITNSFAKSEK